MRVQEAELMTSSNWIIRRLRSVAGDATSRVQEWRTKQALGGEKTPTIAVGAVALAVLVGGFLFWRRRSR